MRRIALALLASAVTLTAAASAHAQCTGIYHVVWPETDPVWEFCWQRPSETTFLANGGGIRIYDVRYKGTTILRDGTVPVLNVKYESGCGCFRDWFYQENSFNCLPTVPMDFPPFDQFCDGGTELLETSCDRPGDANFGNYSGVVVEDKGSSVKLTSQARAGWYRYISTWEFHADGRLEPGMDITSVNNGCIAHNHRHHAYFRLDFDIDGPENDFVTLKDTETLLYREQSFVDRGNKRSAWRIEDPESPVYVEISRNPEDGVANAFAVADGWLLAYDPNELDDGVNSINDCEAEIGDFDNDEFVVDTDIVLWVHAQTFHPGEPGGMATICTMIGPTIQVVEDGSFTPPACVDGDDNDGDGHADWFRDPDCHGPGDDSEEPDCGDGLDNDGDELVDYPDDPDCLTPQWPTETPECSDGLDNDQDGNFDLADVGCAGDPTIPLEATQCNDRIHNDDDGLLDYPFDPGCHTPWDTKEAPACNDGVDNDNDDLIDLADPECRFNNVPVAFDDNEGCGIGAELALLLPGLLWLRRRQSRR